MVSRRAAAIGVMLLAAALAPPGDARIARSALAKAAFKRLHPCPATGAPSGPCPGWIIDHVDPLACGGADSPDNMQWQTSADAKDRWERIGCSPFRGKDH